MSIIRNGNYFKFTDARKDITVIAFCPEVEFDSNFRSMKAIQEYTNNINICGMQKVEDRKELKGFYEMELKNNSYVDIEKYFNNVFYSFYNIYGQIVKSIMIEFNFNNNTVAIGNKIYKVEACSEFTFKILKTKIKAIDGIHGFYKFIIEAMHVGSPFNSSVYSLLERISA